MLRGWKMGLGFVTSPQLEVPRSPSSFSPSFLPAPLYLRLGLSYKPLLCFPLGIKPIFFRSWGIKSASKSILWSWGFSLLLKLIVLVIPGEVWSCLICWLPAGGRGCRRFDAGFVGLRVIWDVQGFARSEITTAPAEHQQNKVAGSLMKCP